MTTWEHRDITTPPRVEAISYGDNLEHLSSIKYRIMHAFAIVGGDLSSLFLKYIWDLDFLSSYAHMTPHWRFGQ